MSATDIGQECRCKCGCEYSTRAYSGVCFECIVGQHRACVSRLPKVKRGARDDAFNTFFQRMEDRSIPGHPCKDLWQNLTPQQLFNAGWAAALRHIRAQARKGKRGGK